MNESLGGLTPRERELVEAAAVGNVLECSQLPIGQLSATDDPEHTIRAELLRDLLLKRCDKPLDPRGVRLHGARITGMLDLSHVEAAVGMELRGCSFDQAVLLEDAGLPWLALTGSCVPALYGPRLVVGGDLVLTDGFRATTRGEHGAVQLHGAHITGTLSLSGAELVNEDGPALSGVDLQVGGSLLLTEGFRPIGRGEWGAVRLLGAHITGMFALRNAKLTNKDGPALDGAKLQVGGDLLLAEGFRATGRGEQGAVRLLGAHITGMFTLSGAELVNEDGPALDGAKLQVGGALALIGGFRATGRGKQGTVRLLGAHITDTLDLSGAELVNEDGPALDGSYLQVGGNLALSDGFRATGRGEQGAVQLLGAHITGMFVLWDAELANENGLVLDLEDAEAKSILIPPKIVCPQRVAGRSSCDTPSHRVNLSGFVYTSLEAIDWRQWLHLIARHTSGYRPQPYQQLAAMHRAVGHDADARQVLIAQQQDLGERGKLDKWARVVHRLWGALGGYGYRTGRIALALLIMLLLAAGVGIAAGHITIGPGRYVAMHPAQADDPHSRCSLTEQIGVGIDRGLPLGTTGIRNRCDFDTTSRWGQALTWTTWVLQFFVWALATLVVAGYVGLIRKVI